MQNESNNGLFALSASPLPLSRTLSLPLAPAVSQSLYSSERRDRSNRQTFGISCEEMWWSPKIKLAHSTVYILQGGRETYSALQMQLTRSVLLIVY